MQFRKSLLNKTNKTINDVYMIAVFFSLIALNDPLSKSQDIKCGLLEDFAPAEILSVSPTCSVMGTRTWFIPRTDFSLI